MNQKKPEPCYNEFARFYDRELLLFELLLIRNWRRRLLSQVTGPRVLEVAIGTGLNLPFYPPGIELTGIDLSRAMLDEAQSKANHLKITPTLQIGNALHLDFENNSFDTIVATFLFCNIEDPITGLREMGRVCKKEGRILLLEHVRPPGALGKLADRLNPWTSTRFCNEHINRQTDQMLTQAGLQPLQIESAFFKIIKLITARPD